MDTSKWASFSGRGLRFRYPKQLFTVFAVAGGAKLKSRYSVNMQPHGISDDALVAHPLQGQIELVTRGAVAALRGDTGNFDQLVFPQGTWASLDPSYGERTKVAGLDAVVVQTGAHGDLVLGWYAPVDDGHTLTARFLLISDYVRGAAPNPEAIPSEEEQLATVRAIVASITR